MVTTLESGAQGFTGFLVQARAPGDTTALGTFTEIPEEAQAISCGSGQVRTLFGICFPKIKSNPCLDICIKILTLPMKIIFLLTIITHHIDKVGFNYLNIDILM